jgi:hypothetical protein
MKKGIFLVAIALFGSIVSFAQVIKGTFAIKNSHTGMVLRIKDANKANGTPLVAYTPVNWKCVTWNFEHIEGQTYQLKNLITNKTFEYSGSGAIEGSSLTQQPLILKKAGQQYEFIAVEGHRYLIRLKNSDLYITPSDTIGSVNSSIVLAKKQEGDLQYWTIYEQDPKY